MQTHEWVTVAATALAVFSSGLSGLFAFLNARAKLQYDADRVRMEAEMKALQRENVDLRQAVTDLKAQLRDERTECDGKIAELKAELTALKNRPKNPFPNR